MALNSVFDQYSVKDEFSSHGEIVVIPSDATIAQAAEILNSKGILAAPVRDVDKPDDAPWSEKYLGLVDANSILWYLLETCQDHVPSSLSELMTKAEAVQTQKVKDCVGSWSLVPFVPVSPTDSLLVPMLLLSKYPLHRLPIIESMGDVQGIITQTSLLKSIVKHRSELESVGNKTISELNLKEERPACVSIDSKTIDAFRLMKEKGVAAVGILGDDDVLIGVLSSTDFRKLISSTNLFSLLMSPLRVFLDALLQDVVNIRQPAIACRPTDKLIDVVERMMTVHIHRMFVVNETKSPIAVLSLSDVLNAYVQEPEGFFKDYFVGGLPDIPGF